MNYSNKELYSECIRLSNAIKLYRNQFVALLPEVNKRQLYKEHGMHSIFEFGAKLAGLSHNTIRKVLKLKNDLSNKPVLNNLFESGEVGWSKLAVITKITTPQNEHVLAAKLHTMSKSALEVLVKDSVPGVAKVERETFSVKIPPRILTKMKVAKLKLEQQSKHPLSWAETFELMADQINQSHQPKNKKTSHSNRYIPVETKHEILQKSNGVCECNNCSKPATTFHHTTPYAISRNHKNLLHVCNEHHQIIHHETNTYINNKYKSYRLDYIKK